MTQQTKIIRTTHGLKDLPTILLEHRLNPLTGPATKSNRGRVERSVLVPPFSSSGTSSVTHSLDCFKTAIFPTRPAPNAEHKIAEQHPQGTLLLSLPSIILEHSPFQPFSWSWAYSASHVLRTHPRAKYDSRQCWVLSCWFSEWYLPLMEGDIVVVSSSCIPSRSIAPMPPDAGPSRAFEKGRISSFWTPPLPFVFPPLRCDIMIRNEYWTSAMCQQLDQAAKMVIRLSTIKERI